MTNPKYPIKMQFSCSYEERDRLRKVSKQVGVSMNELIQASLDFYLTSFVKEWNRLHKEGQKDVD